MRILIWSGGYPPTLGGVEVIVQGLARSLAAQGHLLQIVTQSSSDGEGAVEDAPEGTIHRLPFYQVLASRDPARVAELTATIAAIKRSFEPNLVHAHAVHPSEFFLLRTADVAPCPIVFTVHGWTPMADGADTVRRRMLRRADWVTGCCQYVVDQAVRDVPEIAGRAVTVYNGCQEPDLAAMPLPFNPPRLLCVGRLVASKGFDDVLQALPAVREHHPDTRLRIVGDGPLRSDLQQQSARLGLLANTEFVGEVPHAEVFAHVNESTALVVPSREGSEGLTLVALEAALMRRPVIATRDGGLSEAVVHGRTGLLVESGDHFGLQRAILFVLESPTAAARLGDAGRRHVREHFTWEHLVAGYSSLYEKAIRGEP
jgi:glycogen(starch) synthase